MEQKLRQFGNATLDLTRFTFLILLYPIQLFVVWLGKKNIKISRLKYYFEEMMNSFDRTDGDGVSRLYLIEIAFRNMAVKKTRTLITVGGMAIGISFIVFLVSIGYGLQQMVVSRVAGLEELRQAEVVPGLSENLSLDDETISKFKSIGNVSEVLPLIAVVGRVNYQSSNSDLAVYGATSDYLKYSALQPVQGRLFESNETVFTPQEDPKTIGVGLGKEISPIYFTLKSDVWVPVFESPDRQSKRIGYTKKTKELKNGVEVWGKSYSSTNGMGNSGQNEKGETLGRWIKSSNPLWEKMECPQLGVVCEDTYSPNYNSQGKQTKSLGYIMEEKVEVVTKRDERVLGVDSVNLLPVVEIPSESTADQDQNVEEVEIKSLEKKEVVVNRSVLQLLNIPEGESIGRKISLTMIVVGGLLDDSSKRIESQPIEYEIVGVIPDEGTPVVYVPFLDIRSMGVNRFSQAKVIVREPSQLPLVRSSIESAGYGTVSVADTVAQIDTLFANFRLILSILGLVALTVAALGMFNTLTVSLLERTREVGLMKAMGMKSDEVRTLFLTESMIMGLYGGMLGLLAGALFGNLLSLVLSALSVAKGTGMIDVASTPPVFVIVVILLSVLVGVVTGYFPAKRATNISALNALRYE